MRTIHLRDPDGSFVIGEIVDETHLRVIRSNISERGEILYKPSSIDWEDTHTRKRGGRWLSPHALIEYTSRHEAVEESEPDLGGSE